MSLFDDSFDTKIGGKKSSMFAYMENNQEEDTNVEDEDLSEEEQKAETEAALADLNRNSISSYKFSPALEACDEEMEYLCLQHVDVLATMESIDSQACEAYNNSSSESEQQAVVEGFKESVSKYWERFKAFCIKIKNLIVRTVQRVIGYLKTLFTRIAAKVVAKLRGKDAKKMAKKVGNANPSRYVSKVEVYKELLDADTMDKALKFVDDQNTTYNNSVILNQAKAAIEAAKAETGKLDEYRDSVENTIEERFKTKSELVELAVGSDDPEEIDVTSYHGKIQQFVTDLTKAKIPKSVESTKKSILKSIETIEKMATKSKSISSKRMSLLTYIMNKAVQQMNALLAAIQQVCVMWLQARIKVVNKFYNATEEREEEETEESYIPSTKSSSVMDFYLSL
ncbi:MAG: hypothetical protein SPF22_08150 [Candidatus Onthovivens sp.]|nr:hypothetical protein [Candidatus Onthovivens sp.]